MRGQPGNEASLCISLGNGFWIGGGGALHMLKCVWARNWEAKKCLFQIFFSFFACISKGGLPGKALFVV